MRSLVSQLVIIFVLLSPCGVQAEIPIEDFVRHGDYLDIALSPDGTHYSARLRSKGRVFGIVVNRATGKATASVRGGLGDEIASLIWVNNDRLIYTFAEKSPFYDTAYTKGELFAINKDGSRNELIYGYRADDKKLGTRLSKNRKNSFASQEYISRMKNDKDYILILEHPWELRGNTWWNLGSKKTRVTRLHTVSGRKTVLEVLPHNGASAVADEEGNVLFATWTDTEARYRSAFRANNEAEWQEIESLFKFGQKLSPSHINKAMGKAWLWGDSGEAQLKSLYEVDFRTLEYKLLFDDLTADLAYYYYSRDVPILAVSEPDSIKYHYRDKQHPLALAHRKLAKAFAGQRVSIRSATDTEEEIVVRVSSDVNPGEYYVFNTKTNKADLLWANRSWIDPAEMNATQAIKLQARDGTELNGLLTLPRGITRAPLVVIPHGGPFGVKDRWAYDSETQLLANRGYGVLQINFRGSGGYGRKFEEAGHREWGGAMIDDIVDATRWALANNYTDADKMCIYGASYGGYAALMAAVREPDLYRCTIGYVGVYDLEYLFTEGVYEKLDHTEAFFKRTVGDDPGTLKENSPVNHAEKIKAAVMLVHGNKDLIAPALHTREMRKALLKAGKYVTWLQFDTAGHGIRDEEDRVKFYQSLLSFLGEHIN